MSKLRHTVLPVLATALVALIAAASASAQSTEPVNDADRAFLIAAAQSNLAEIQTGEMAERRAHSRAVRTIGRKLVRDHRAQLKLGAASARFLGITAIPTSPNAAQQAVARRLAKLRGRAFDRAFLRAQVTAHEQAIKVHVNEAKQTANPTLRTLAINALPLLGAHLGMVQIVRLRR